MGSGRQGNEGFLKFARGRWRGISFGNFASVTSDEDSNELSPLSRNLLLGLLMGVPVATLMCFLIGGWVSALVVGLIGCCAIQGLWRGAAEIAGLVVGLLFAMLLAAVLGRMFEGAISTITGTRGVLGRLISTLVCGVFLALLAWGAGTICAQRVLRDKPEWRSLNKLAGGGIGVIEGILLALIVLWVPSAVRPIAAMRASADREAALSEGLTNEQADARVLPLARRVLAFAEDVEQSTIGSVAVATNPIEHLGVLDLAEDFITITRDKQAKEALAKTQAWQDFMNLSSMQQARAMVEQDPTLQPLLDKEGITIGGMRQLLESDTAIRVLDQTTLAKDLEAMKQRLTEAVRTIGKEARQRREKGPK